MTSKAEFNAEEWSTIVEGPLYAGMRVIAADRGGTLRESLAMSRVYQAAREQHGQSELLDELLKSPPSIEPDQLQKAGADIGTVISGRLQDAIRIVEAKATPEEADSYKR